MARINSNKLFKVKKLYQSGFSAREISEELSVSIHAVYYFFRKYSIPRRNQRENRAIQFQKKKPSFQVKKILTSQEKILKIAGVMLYWAEGSQWHGEVIVDFANSNPDMIKIFLAFLRKVCGIDEEKLRAYLYCYSDQDPRQLVKFWSNLTNIPLSHFTKPYIRKDFKVSKSGKMKYGLIHIRYNDKKLLLLIKDWINQFIGSY